MQYILSLSYGKDSLACLGAIEQLGLPLDRIVHAEVWATDTIPADLPPMVEFKGKADKIIKDRWGIDVEHVCATKKEPRGDSHSQFANVERESESDSSHCRLTYERMFYQVLERGKHIGNIKGFPPRIGAWCKKLKIERCIEAYLRGYILSDKCQSGMQKINTVQYLGIAADEPERLARLDGVTKVAPLALAGWSEADAKRWCIENDLLSPIYTDTCLRGGCWFCHNQGIQQLRELRHNYPDLWALLLKWDADSPVAFHADGHTVHDFDARFCLEDEGIITSNQKWRWEYLNAVQLSLF